MGWNPEWHRKYDRSPKGIARRKKSDAKRQNRPDRVAYRQAHQHKWNFEWKYGVPHTVYLQLESQQKGLCASCGKLPPVYKRTARLYVDHNHETGEIRGLLCQPCNLAVGWVEKDSERLGLARSYLSREH